MPYTVINVSHVMLTAVHVQSNPIDVHHAHKDLDYLAIDVQVCIQSDIYIN